MSAKHTPGPWSYGLSPVRETLFVGSADTWVCGEIDNPNTPLRAGEAEANARLIAAAPDMLAALRDLTACHSEGGFIQPDDEVLLAARAAIAKAEAPQ